MTGNRIVVIGAGIGGLSAAVRLAARGLGVTVLERAATPGGKLREVEVGGARIDAGPTVMTLRPVFEELFDVGGSSLEAELRLRPAAVLARHAWGPGERLDLHGDPAASEAAIGAFAGAAEARRFRHFARRAARVWQTLAPTFVHAPRPSLLDLVARVGPARLGALWQISPFETLWGALGREFRDPRLRQLFARYATYCGSSPYRAPATLMLVAAAEQQGVWLVEGGMHRIAAAVAGLAARLGVTFRYGSEVREITVANGRASGVLLAGGEQLAADAVLFNGDVAALGAGLLGRGAQRAVPAVRPAARSLSALTWNVRARTRGFPLARHTVFFSGDYAAEFSDIFGARRLPRAPTVYVCAQDRGDDTPAPSDEPERLLCIVNAPATGDTARFGAAEVDLCEDRSFALLARCGLELERGSAATLRTTPQDFARLYPATGGALYGRSSHGWRASFQRPGSRCRLPGLYLAGGSTHPGPGIPMATISGGLAAAALLADLGLTSPSHRAATPGGTSMPSAMTTATGSR